MRIKDHFHINDSTLSLAWKQRLEATPKWPITTRKSGHSKIILPDEH